MTAVVPPALRRARGADRPRLAVAVWAVAGVVVLALLLVAGRYGFHGDEFYFVVTGRHLQVAAPDNPMLVPYLAAGWYASVGGQLWAFRVLPALASGAYVLLGGLIAREFGAPTRHQETTGRFAAEELVDGMVPRRWLRAALRPPLRLVSRWINVKNPTDTMAMIKAEDGFDVRSRLPGIQTETLVIYGAKDRFWPLEMVAETDYRMPHGRLIIYPELGHSLVTSPKFGADVVAFLNNQEGSSRAG